MKCRFFLQYPSHVESAKDTNEFYCQLREMALENIAPISNQIVITLCQFPDIQKSLNPSQLKEFIHEIVKNIFDSVNSAKVDHPEIEGIEIDVSVKMANNKIYIKITDNGGGFNKLQLSKKVLLSHYLNGKNATPFFGNFFNFIKPKVSNDHIKSDKSLEKQKGKFYILGSCGVGLMTMDKAIKEQGGVIRIKNRKEQGAAIEIELPATTQNQIPQVMNDNFIENEKGMNEIIEEMDDQDTHSPLIMKKTYGTFKK